MANFIDPDCLKRLNKCMKDRDRYEKDMDSTFVLTGTLL